jgi:hypothetical protein
MSQPSNWIDPRLAEKLEVLRPVTSRDPQMAAAGRELFLATAARLASSDSPSKPSRMAWIEVVSGWFAQREPATLRMALSGLLVIVMLAFAGLIPAARAAGASLPGDSLYWFKLLIEDARLELVGTPAERIEMSMESADRRIEEAEALVGSGREIPHAFTERLAYNLDAAFQIASTLPDDEMIPLLERLQLRLESQEQRLLRIGSAEPDPALVRAQEILRIRLAWTTAGLLAPQQFREQNRLRDGWNQPPAAGAAGWGPGNPTPGVSGTVPAGQHPSRTPTPLATPSPLRQQASPTGTKGASLQPTAVNTRAATPSPALNCTAMPSGTAGNPGSTPQQNPTAGGTQSGPGPQATQQPPGGGQHP